MTYSAEFLGLIPRKDEYDRQLGEMYYRCKIKNNGKDINAIIIISSVLLGHIEIVTEYLDHYNWMHCYPTRDAYLKLKIEPKDGLIYKIIVEDKNMPLRNLILDEFKDIKFTYHLPTFDKNQVKDVIFNDPATIVLWKDGTKTVVKCQKDKGDTYNPELRLAMCIIKKMCDNKGNYNDVLNKWLPSESK
jgi:hypothetical protein